MHAALAHTPNVAATSPRALAASASPTPARSAGPRKRTSVSFWPTSPKTMPARSPWLLKWVPMPTTRCRPYSANRSPSAKFVAVIWKAGPGKASLSSASAPAVCGPTSSGDVPPPVSTARRPTPASLNASAGVPGARPGTAAGPDQGGAAPAAGAPAASPAAAGGAAGGGRGRRAAGGRRPGRKPGRRERGGGEEPDGTGEGANGHGRFSVPEGDSAAQ